jgi:hypothetical protein
MFEYFYHEILRKTIIGFGSLFNNINIKKINENGDEISSILVPLAYGPMQKFLARLEQSPDLNKKVQITLPRMSFEFVGLSYDPSRKVTNTQTFLSSKKTDASDIRKTYMPVPYNMDFELVIYTKLNDDMLQIIEQIIPYFQPGYTLSIDLISEIGEKRDVPIILNNINMQDEYEGDFSNRRSLIYTLNFTAKTYLFGPISKSTSSDIIKKVSIGLVSGSTSTGRDLTYTVTPVATKSYTDDTTTILTTDMDLTTTLIEVQDASLLSENSYFSIGEETIRVLDKSNNKLTIQRGSYGTKINSHVSGSEIKLITNADNDLIEVGDDFGFNDNLL